MSAPARSARASLDAQSASTRAVTSPNADSSASTRPGSIRAASGPPRAMSSSIQRSTSSRIAGTSPSSIAIHSGTASMP